MANVENIKIENAKIAFRNFSGKPDKFNPVGGKRTFCVLLDTELANQLVDEGWNIKQLKPRDVDDEPKPFLQVKVNFGTIPPKIYMITKRAKVLLDEESIDALDYAEIENIDLIIRPYNYNANGKTGIAAYVKNMYVTVMEDEFADKYADMDR